MYFYLEDYRPDTPRIPNPISIREAVLISVIVHLVFVISYLLVPEEWFERQELLAENALVDPQRQPPLRFVEVMPLLDRMEQPVRPADQSDLDRRSQTRERPPDAMDPVPFMRGNTPEMIEGGPSASAPPAAPPSPPARPEAEAADASVLPPADRGFASLPPQPASPSPSQAAPTLGDQLRNLQQYLRQENFDNPRGGDTEQSADIQFDSMGIDFGPWLRRFKNQVERNWLVPAAAMSLRTRVVIRFNVLRNGYITDLTVLQPASVPALTNAALNALRLSNPTAELPPEYPAEKVLFTVTFYYNERPQPGP
jgi:TonB family protein